MPSVVRVSTPQGTAGIPAVAATLYSCAAQLRASSTTRNGRVNIAWYNAAGVFISRSSDAWKSVTSAAWIGSQIVGQAAPALTAFMALEIEFDANMGEAFYADQMILATGSNPSWAAGGYGSNAVFIIERSEDGGLTWTEVRGATRLSPAPIDAGSSTAKATVYDRELPLRTAVRYRGYARTGTSSLVFSTPATTADARTDATSWWLKDPHDPTTDIAVAAVEFQGDVVGGESGTVFYPEGREDPMVVHGNRPSGDVFTIKLWAKNQTDFNKIMTLLKSKETLFLHDVLGMTWYVKVTGKINFDRQRANPQITEVFPLRHLHQISCEVTEVGAP